MDTVRSLPDVQGRRFGNVAIGYDKIDQIRTDFSALESLAALMCGCERDVLTRHMVEQMTALIRARTQTLTGEELAAVDGFSDIDLLAMGIVLKPA